MSHDAIVLTGGRASRLDGADKAAIELGGRALLAHVLEATSDAGTTVVVGPTTSAYPAAQTVREEPPGGGPVAGIAAGLASLASVAEGVLVLACDVPGARHAVPFLVRSLEDSTSDGAVALDDDGYDQPLLALYRRVALERALASLGGGQNRSMRALLDGMWLDRVSVPGGVTRDADTWNDVEQLRKEWA